MNKVEVITTEGQLREAAAYLAGEWGDARVADAKSPGRGAELTWKRLHWMELGNPHHGAAPMGWLLRAEEGEVVGVHLAMRHRFKTMDGASAVAVCSHNYYVSEAFRGMPGLALFQRFWAMRKEATLICLTAGANSAEFWRRFGAQPAEGFDAEWMKVWRPGPLVEEALLRRGLPGIAARCAAWLMPFRIGGGRKRADADCHRLAPSDMDRCALEMARDPSACGRVEYSGEYLRWRYSMPEDQGLGLWEVIFAGGEKVWVGIRERRRGMRQQVLSIQVLDVVGPADRRAAALDLVATVNRRDSALCQMRGIACEADDMQAAGFRRRGLSACIAWTSAMGRGGGLRLQEADGDGGCYG